MDHQHYATCPNEITDLLATEIASLGGRDLRTGYRVVYFSASKELAYKVNLHSRLASRIHRVLKDIPAHSPTIIFDKAKRIRFHELFSHEQAVNIRVVASNNAGEIPTHLIGSKLREAIIDCFQHHLDVLPNQISRNAVIGISGYLHRKRLTVSVDTSLESLHRRGYRIDGHPAPLKETLAAALLAACEYDGTVCFFDPMCGSGTLAVEAALIASHRAPHLLRTKGAFGFEHLLDFDPDLWQAVGKQARAAVRPASATIFASDIEPRFVELARQTATNAGLDGAIRFETRDFFCTDKVAERGLLLANIPYGVRMTEADVSAEFLGAFGDHLKNHFKGWRCGIVAPASAPLKAIGLKPRRQVPFLNGTVPVKLVVLEIY